jgi:hypothetical protein
MCSSLFSCTYSDVPKLWMFCLMLPDNSTTLVLDTYNVKGFIAVILVHISKETIHLCWLSKASYALEVFKLNQVVMAFCLL